MGERDGDVDLVLAFLNTVDVEAGTDVLAEGRTWRDWVSSRKLGTPSETGRTRMVRDALRATVRREPAPSMEPVTVQVDLRAGIPALGAEDALGKVLAAAARIAVRGQWGRIKLCPADDCRCAFYDESRNRSRNWCTMSVCGNRAKARNWRQRRSSAPVSRK